MDHLDEYCCVAFMEEGQKKMATVPSNWLLNSMLYWPRTNWSSMMKRRAPPKDSWIQVPNPTVLFTGSHRSCLAIDSGTEAEGEGENNMTNVTFSDEESELSGEDGENEEDDVPDFPRQYSSPQSGLSIKPTETNFKLTTSRNTARNDRKT